MIYAVSTVLNEADIVESTFRHLLAEGVDGILVADGMSKDGTRDILSDMEKVRIFDDGDPFHRQPRWINTLAAIAHEEHGADWILPVDADEYWYAPEGTIRETLARVPDDAQKVYARMFKHSTWELRHREPTALPKVAYRFSPYAWVSNGNHDVTLPGAGVWGLLDIREFQYRGFEHFCRKAEERNRTIDPGLPATDGAHHRRLAGLDEREMRREWAKIEAIPTIYDPCPSSFPLSMAGSSLTPA